MAKKKEQKNDVVTIKCYGTVEKMRRQEAIKEYKEGMLYCDGSERDRYTTIYLQLIDGYKYCTDEYC